MSSYETGPSALLPLKGIQVLDFSRTMAGPFATMLLADLGATVIKVEGLGSHQEDTTRNVPPMFGGVSSSFLSLNRSKLSLAIDLANPEAQPIIDRLALQSDIVVENLRWRNSQRFGLTWERFEAVNPDLIFCRISGFGATGPLKETAAYDLTVQAATGALDITGEPGRPPAKMGVPVVDLQTGVAATIAMLAALRKREEFGGGSNIDISMFDVAINMLGYMGVSYLNLGMIPSRLGSGHQTLYPYNAFATKDRYIVVAPFTQRFWRSFCDAIECKELIDDPRYLDFAERLKNRETLSKRLNEVMLERTASDWLERLLKADVPAGPVNTVADALRTEQTSARGMLPMISIPTIGDLEILGSPFKLSGLHGEELPVSYAPPAWIGEHTRSVLTDVAGLSAQEVQHLIDTGVVASDDGEHPPTTNTQSVVVTKPVMKKSPSGAKLTASSEGVRGPLDGLRVLDLTRMAAGPFCTLMLADLGADVVKVESIRVGDPTRRNLPILEGTSVYFLSLNRGKRSVSLDMKTEEGRDRVLELARSADVVVENFRPGVMDRLGLSYESLSAINPRIVMCSISGFGATGPMKNYTSFDLVNQAFSGYMSVTGEEGRPPVRLGWPVGDLGAGAFSSVALLAALHRVREVGEGCRIDISLHDCLVSQLAYLGQTYLLSGEEPHPVGGGHVNIAPYGVYSAADGDVAIAAYTEDAWQALIGVLDLKELADDPRFKTRVTRRSHRLEVDEALASAIRLRTVAELTDLLGQEGLAYSPVVNVGQALEAAKVGGRNLVVDVLTEVGTPTLGVASPFVIDGVRMVSSRRAPGLGEHDAEDLWSAKVS